MNVQTGSAIFRPSNTPPESVADFDSYNAKKDGADPHAARTTLPDSTQRAIACTPHHGGHFAGC